MMPPSPSVFEWPRFRPSGIRASMEHGEPSESISREDRPDPTAVAAPTVWLHGAVDDHLRLITLLSWALEERSDREAAAVCRKPSSKWSTRCDAFENLLRSVRQRVTVRVVDIDALLDGVDEPDIDLTPWADHEFSRQKRQTTECLARATRVQWQVVRPSPSARIDSLFTMPDNPFVQEPIEEPIPAVRVRTADDDARDVERFEQAVGGLQPAVRPLARGLVESDVSDYWTIGRLIESAPPDKRNSVLMEAAYDSLPPTLRDSARLLSAHRGPRFLNGHFGFFSSRPDNDNGGLPSVPGEHLDLLVERGWIRRRGARCGVMYRPLRRFLQIRDEFDCPDAFESVHRCLGQRYGIDSPESLTEAHHHAIVGLDAQRAIETARYYGTDLREVARRLSMKEQFTEAWRLYHQIIDEFDNEDAYAWEYYAYNLAKADGDPVEVLRAYERAAKLDSANPLYQGRLHGHRARCGHDVTVDFDRIMSHLDVINDTRAVGFFAKPVFDGLCRARRYKVCRNLASRWGTVLNRNEYLREAFGRRAWWAGA